LRFEIVHPGTPFEEAKHGTHFAGRAASNVDEREQFVRCATLETLGDVIRDRDDGAFKLIAK
jgi:hypothetical protein